MKYPKKNRALIKLPIKCELDNKWYISILLKNGTTEKASSLCNFDKSEHCYRCCRAYNLRKGYTEKEVSKIIKAFYNVKKEGKVKLEKTSEKKRGRSKKSKKAKEKKQLKKSNSKRPKKAVIKKSFFNN